MGLFSSIGNALGGLVKTAIPAVGTFFGGPVGGAIGSVLSGGLDFLDNNAGAIAGAAGQYFSAEQANAMNAERLAQQQEYNVTNAATANAFTERMLSNQYDRNNALQEDQFKENRYLQSAAFAENRATVDRALQFERDMSNTAYQRATADLSKAGLNRILAVSQGGASTPNAPAPSAPTGSASSASVGSGSGAMASASVIPALETFGPAISTAMQVKTFDQNLRNARAQEQLIKEQAKKTTAETISELERPEFIKAQKFSEWQRPGLIDAQTVYNKALRDLINQQTKTETQRTGTESANRRIQTREAEDTEKYGTSKLGRESAALVRILDTLWANLRGM